MSLLLACRSPLSDSTGALLSIVLMRGGSHPCISQGYDLDRIIFLIAVFVTRVSALPARGSLGSVVGCARVCVLVSVLMVIRFQIYGPQLRIGHRPNFRDMHSSE